MNMSMTMKSAPPLLFSRTSGIKRTWVGGWMETVNAKAKGEEGEREKKAKKGILCS